MDRGEAARAKLVLQQWIGDVPLDRLAASLSLAAKGEPENPNIQRVVRSDLKWLGQLCATSAVLPVALLEIADSSAHDLSAFEAGWVDGLASLSNRRLALRLWQRCRPQCLSSWIKAVHGAARDCRWGEVRALLNRLEGDADRLQTQDRLASGWYAARAGFTHTTLWQEPLSWPDYGLTKGSASLSQVRLVAKWITYTDIVREPAQVAEDLLPLLDQRKVESRNISAVTLLIRASAVAGRLLRYCDRADFPGVEIAVPAATLRPYLDALWCAEPDWKNLPYDEVHTATKVGAELAEIAWGCGSIYGQLLGEIARERFTRVMLQNEGKRLFDILQVRGEQAFLLTTVSGKALEIIGNMHRLEVTSRNDDVASLIHFTTSLGLTELTARLAEGLPRSRIGYLSHADWTFYPLVRWFELARRNSPALWRTIGIQLLALDDICNRQGGENRFDSSLFAQIAVAAAACGPEHYEACMDLLASRPVRHPRYDLAGAVRTALKIRLDKGVQMCDSVPAQLAIGIGLGRWPSQSALVTVNELLGPRTVSPNPMDDDLREKAFLVAAEIQNLPPDFSPSLQTDDCPVVPALPRSAEQILQDFLSSTDSSLTHIANLAELAEQTNREQLANRTDFIVAALEALESSSVLSRYFEFDHADLAVRLYRNLTEPERWRLLGAITAITGERKKELSRPHWVFMVAFSAVDLMCLARAADLEDGFTTAMLDEVLDTHWKWHGSPPRPFPLVVRGSAATWPDTARRVLLKLTDTDACETLYMAMSGLRFLAEMFPDQIASICADGLAAEWSKDAVLSLAQLWATRHPSALTPVLEDFEELATCGPLDDRLDAWAVTAIHSIMQGRRAASFCIPPAMDVPEISFPGDSRLFEGESEMDGLMRRNAFSRMTNVRLDRVGWALGPMEKAFRHVARQIKEGKIDLPPTMCPSPTRLAFEGASPRQEHTAERVVGDAIMRQSGGGCWPPARASLVRLQMGFGMDPWIASAPPNRWVDETAWPSRHAIEQWFQDGADPAAETGKLLRSLLEGYDLGSDVLLLGAELRCSSYRRDVMLRAWLESSDPLQDTHDGAPPMSMYGRTQAGWIGGWSFSALRPAEATSVHFAGALVNFPNSDLDVTPTDQWQQRWGWRLDSRSGLRFQSGDGTPAAWYERWFGPDASQSLVCRQPLLSRWLAYRHSLPTAGPRVHAWIRRVAIESHPLAHPE